VPTVFYAYPNYRELADDASVPTHARTTRDVRRWLRLLVGSAPLRRELAATQRHFARSYTPDAVARRYADALRALAGG